ncbi:amino acid permease [Methanocella sp.]|uniref:amino acid permease n=1 Tax=Methanocella sp. TaxID=2052833 RepID=UPI002D7EA6B6|nr:amino acid permease [Methanocella sp.]
MADMGKQQAAQQATEPKVEVVKLKRDLGVLGSFSIGFADVGADIYVALGLVLFFAAGAAPLALAVAALGYIFTALSYAELASAIPMAGGASIFAREAFDDFWSFIAGWGLLLDYTIDIALFGWITMGYLGSFLSNLGSVGVPYVGTLAGLNSINTMGISGAPNYTFQAVATIILCIVLMALNYIGIRESANLNIVLSIVSIISEIALLLIGFALVWNLPTFIHNITQLGTGVSWTSFGWGITVAMVSFIGLESISQAAEETKRPDRTIPRATKALIVAVILAGLLLCSLAVGLPKMSPTTIGTTYQNDPVTGVAKGICLSLSPANPLVTFLPLWVGLLGVLMLLMSTNTGVIGASRVTYSMARYRIMPQWFSKLHPKYRVPTRTIIVFSLASIGFVVFVWVMGTYKLTSEDPTIILGDLYNYGALVSFMLVNLSLIKLRSKRPDLYRPYKSPWAFNIHIRGKDLDVPILPVLGFFVCLFVWILVLNLHQIGKIVGTLWFIVGVLMYLAYRKSQNLSWRDHIPGTQVTDPGVAHELHPEISAELKNKYEGERAMKIALLNKRTVYRNILVPISRPETIDNIVEIASDLLEPGGMLHIINAMEVPPQLPTGASIINGRTSSMLMSAVEKAKSYSVKATAEAITTRSIVDAIVQMAQLKKCDLIVMGSSQRTMTQKVLFGNVVDNVLRESPCDVAVFSYTGDLAQLKYRKILVPTTGFQHSTRALDIALNLQKKFKGIVTSMYVGKKSEKTNAEAILDNVNRMAEGSGVEHSAIFMSGSVVDSIIDAAKDGYDLVIIGATERPSYYKQLLGSTADEIVKSAPCNVLVVRTKK